MDSAMAHAPATCAPPAAIVAKRILGLPSSVLIAFDSKPPRLQVPSCGAVETFEDRNLRPPSQRLLRTGNLASPGVDRQIPRAAFVEEGSPAANLCHPLASSARKQERGCRQSDDAHVSPERLL